MPPWQIWVRVLSTACFAASLPYLTAPRQSSQKKLHCGNFGAPDSPAYGLLKLTPWRIELWSLPDMMKGVPNSVWRNGALAPP